jgi:DNA-directed RNA polymerase specialized sigma24 family protein
MKRPRQGFESFLAMCQDYKDLPRVPDPVEMEARVAALRSGQATQTDLNWIIMQHMRMTLAKVGEFVRYSQVPDFIGEAMLLLVETVNRASLTLTDNNITAYISGTFNRRFYDFIGTDPTLRIPRRTIRRANKEGTTHLARREAVPISTVEPTVLPEEPMVDIIDLLERVPRTRQERTALRLRMAGFNYEEIGERIHIRKSRVSEVFDGLRVRYEAIAC